MHPVATMPLMVPAMLPDAVAYVSLRDVNGAVCHGRQCACIVQQPFVVTSAVRCVMVGGAHALCSAIRWHAIHTNNTRVFYP